MITVDLARALLAEGVLWEPRAGDRFVLDRAALHADVFWISDLTVEVHHFGGQSVLGFNGTTEWALDSVDLDQALWLPREDQLRTLLGDRLRSLSPAGEGWTVAYAVRDVPAHVTDPDVECAYARALLDAVSREARG